jgi:hypothetical protein
MKVSIDKLYARLVFSALSICLSLFTTTTVIAANSNPFEVATVIGGSLHNGQPAEDGPQAGIWYRGGDYKTWVDRIAALTDHNYHWLNYAQAGAVSSSGVTQIEKAISQTTWPDEFGVPTPHVKTLVMSFWANTFLWGPFNQTAVDTMISDMNTQIATAKANGIEKIIVMGMPRYEDLDLDHFLQIFPLPGHIDEAGYNEVRQQYYQAFSLLNPDYLFVDSWCIYSTVDGLHADYRSASHAASQVLYALQSYDQMVGSHNFIICHP